MLLTMQPTRLASPLPSSAAGLATRALIDLLGPLGIPTADLARLWLRLETVRPLIRAEVALAAPASPAVAILAHWRAASVHAATVDHMACVSPALGRAIRRACAAAGLPIVDNCQGED